MDTNIECPFCGQSYYMENYVTRTAIYFPPVYKDGININPDRNYSIHQCTCLACNKSFSYKEQGGNIINGCC